MHSNVKKTAAVIVVVLLAFTACGKNSGGPVAMLSAGDKKYVAQTLSDMKSDVRIALFSRDGGDCRYCDEAEGLLADVAAAAPRVKVEVLSLKKDAARAKDLGIDKVPGIALLGGKDFNLRHFGLPSGYDFIPFVETIRAVANDDPGLSGETIMMLKKLTKPVQLTVFVNQH